MSRVLFTHFPKIRSGIFTPKQGFRPFHLFDNYLHKLTLFLQIFIVIALRGNVVQVPYGKILFDASVYGELIKDVDLDATALIEIDG